METGLLMSDIVVLTKDAAQITSREEYASATVMTLYAWLFAKVRSYRIDDYIGADKACSTLFEAIDAAQSWAQITLAKVSIRFGPFLRLLHWR